MDAVRPVKSDARSAWKNMTAGMDFSFLSPAPSSHKASLGESSTVLVCDHSFTGRYRNKFRSAYKPHLTRFLKFFQF